MYNHRHKIHKQHRVNNEHLHTGQKKILSNFLWHRNIFWRHCCYCWWWRHLAVFRCYGEQKRKQTLFTARRKRVKCNKVGKFRMCGRWRWFEINTLSKQFERGSKQFPKWLSTWKMSMVALYQLVYMVGYVPCFVDLQSWLYTKYLLVRAPPVLFCSELYTAHPF